MDSIFVPKLIIIGDMHWSFDNILSHTVVISTGNQNKIHYNYDNIIQQSTRQKSSIFDAKFSFNCWIYSVTDELHRIKIHAH